MLRTARGPLGICLLLATALAGQVRDPNGAYLLEAPAGWTASAGEGTAMVKHPTNGAGLMLVVGQKAQDTLDELAAMILSTLQAQAPDRKETGRQRTRVCGFDALLVRSQRTANGHPMRDDMYVLFTATRQFCIITQCPAALDARQGEAPLKAALASLRIEGQPNQAAPAPLLHPLWGTPFGPGTPGATPSTDPTPQPKAPPFKMRALRDAKGVWAVNVPADWTAVDNQTYVMASSPDKRVNVTLYAGPAEQRSLQEFFQSMIPELKKQCTRWTLIGQRPLPVAGRQGLNARVESVIQGVEIHTDYALVQNERNLLVVTCNCPKAEFAANQLKFGHILDSLRFCAGAAEPDERNLLNPPLR
ncbi:MAG TPA: hypothetical protein VNE39_05540 [Planctomycetota bacterium]|nr:hypothetical protein [Planctomycetota bacterium]